MRCSESKKVETLHKSKEKSASYWRNNIRRDKDGIQQSINIEWSNPLPPTIWSLWQFVWMRQHLFPEASCRSIFNCSTQVDETVHVLSKRHKCFTTWVPCSHLTELDSNVRCITHFLFQHRFDPEKGYCDTPWLRKQQLKLNITENYNTSLLQMHSW